MVYSLVLLAASLVWIWAHWKHRIYASGFALLIAWAAIASSWHHAYWNWYAVQDVATISAPDSTLVCLRARLTSEAKAVAASDESALNPIPTTEQTKYLCEALEVRDGQTWKSLTGNFELVLHNAIDVYSGDQLIEVAGRIVTTDSTRNPGQFDFRVHGRSKRRNVRVHVYHPAAVTLIEREGQVGAWYAFAHWRSRIRKQLNELAWKHVPYQQASFASAILLGNRQQLENGRQDVFLTTGTIHLLAISGLHIGILAAVFFFVFRLGFIKRRTALILTIVFVIFFAWLVEFRPPVLRASILIVLFCSARLMGRSGLSYNLLALAALIVLAINPSDLFQIGPQLSFLAVGSIIFCKPWIYPGAEVDPVKKLIASTQSRLGMFLQKLRTNAWITIKVSAFIWLIAFPLIALRFHLIVPAALLLNPLVMLPIAVALYAGLGVLVVGVFWPGGADVCGWICGKSLSSIEWLIHRGQHLPAGHFWTSGPSEWAVVVFYLGLFAIAIYPLTKLNGRVLFAFVLMWTTFFWVLPDWMNSSQTKDRAAELTFIDTGHGGSVLIELPERTLLYDAGCFGSAKYGAMNISGVLWDRKVEHIDGLIISHADVDHFNSAVELMQRFSIGAIYMTRQMAEDDSPAVKMLMEEVGRMKIPIVLVADGARFNFDSSETQVQVIGPPKLGTGGNDNSNSVVLELELFGNKILLPGDLEDAGLKRLLLHYPQRYDLVMAPHHGSANSEPEAFAEWANPNHIVISGSSKRVDWDVVNVFRAKGIRTWVTSRDGAVRCSIANGGIHVSCWVHGDWQDRDYFESRGFF